MNRKMVKGQALQEGWQEVMLGDVCIVKRGGSPRPIQKYLTTSEQGINWLRIGDVGPQSKYISKTKEKIKPEGLRKSVLVKEGEFILSNSMSYGRPYIMKITSCVHDGWLVLSAISKNVHKEYLYYALLDNRVQNTFKTLSAGSGVRNLKKASVSSIQLTLPPLPEQKAIASLLQKWDTAIEKTEALIAAKEKRFQWLLKTLISDQQDNPEWRKVKLGEVCTFEYGKPLKEESRKGNQYPVFGSNGIVGYHDEYFIDGPFIIIGRKGSAGSVQYSQSSGFPIDTTFYAKLQDERIFLRFLYYLLILLQLNKNIAQSGVPGLNRNDAYKLQISIPPLDDQKEITNILNSTQHEIDLLSQLAEKHRTQKLGLMQKLLTGAWRVINEIHQSK